MEQLQVDALLDAAIATTGHSDFGSLSFRPNMDHLVKSLEASGNLNEVGIEASRREFKALLVNRLLLQHWLEKFPEILAEPIKAPVFATGLPRSGTTLLLHLFDHDPALRLLRTWEARRPFPPPGFAPESVDERIVATQRDLELQWRAKVEGFDAIHLLDADGPDECTQLLSNDFNQAGFLNYLNVPEYFDWLVDNADFRATYELHKQQLQLLQWRGNTRRWVLKYPNHLLALEEIRQVYPDARYLITHRDPVKTLASLCQLTLAFRSARSDRVDAIQIGQQMLHFVHRHVESLLSYCESAPAWVLHINYYKLTDNPLGIMKRAYDFLDEDFTPAIRDAVENWITENPQGKRGSHNYQLEDFGLTRSQVEPYFASYRQHFDIHIED